MIWLFFLILFVIVLLIAIYAFILLYWAGGTPIPEPTPPTELVDITDFNCCVINGQPIDQVYIPEYGFTVTPEPQVASIACFNNSVIGFESCEQLVIPGVKI